MADNINTTFEHELRRLEQRARPQHGARRALPRHRLGLGCRPAGDGNDEDEKKEKQA